ncbi:HalOD1 output domain-containing protein [Natronorubrum aibiense]|uniref:Halobacterial output domain-containing protein n=1 Tax=Natronorubrum aibiense TaxID=348826 RepID=A0A5P9P1I7_9EURY|nr:HalOD1 output domain-containing protein [Natronorubrum aibiense]QFU81995.1 hypothetical protein GCU68_05355 [Natronorubrum aibiense]
MNDGRSVRDDSVADMIISAVADAEGVDTLELPPLWDVIDPDALEAVFAPSNGGRFGDRIGRLSFEYCSYVVTVEFGHSTTVTLE